MDKGSALGRWVTKLITGSTNPPPKDKEAIINIITRGIIYILICIALSPTAFVSLWAWVICSVVLTVLATCALIS